DAPGLAPAIVGVGEQQRHRRAGRRRRRQGNRRLRTGDRDIGDLGGACTGFGQIGAVAGAQYDRRSGGRGSAAVQREVRLDAHHDSQR
ncbi:hypothetical protein, partial [Klebsiella pneumoniae]|uniref:hypothetical protein n=1 Tax=Klebsiella pneumoniae TaxID=573 RepID=UPI0013D64253